MARLVRQTILLAGLTLILGCRTPAPQAPAVPRPPDESLRVTFVYPDSPVLLDGDEFHRSLNELAEQLTVLYLLAPNGEIPLADLRTLADVQTKNYRYGVLILLVDLSAPARWPDLKPTQERARANFPAVYLENGSAFLNSFLKTGPVGDNQVWIIDAGRNEKIPVTRPIDAWKLNEQIKQILTRRSLNSES